jgi:hypothetical protein
METLELTDLVVEVVVVRIPLTQMVVTVALELL